MDTLQIKAFRLELAAQRLWQGEDEVRLTAKAFAVLRYLVDHREQLVSRDDLFEAVWGTPYVSEAALAACIRELRRALGDSAQQPTFIQTVRGRGYRFVAEVTTADSPVPLIPATACEAPPMAASGVPQTLAVERRQLTVLFCDLVDSTRLAEQLDPEDLREVLRAYHQSCAEVVARFDGYVAQYLGDGVLVYFGYPVAHEDDAQRAVWSGLGLLEALAALNTRLALPAGYQLAVRLGVHTGLVVVGNVGIGERQEPLAQGETPPIAARLQSLAGANELVISSATRELVGGVFRVKDLGAQALPGVAAPLQVYRVLGAQGVASRFEAMTVTGLTPLVGRDEELELLWRRWQQATEGEGQVVLLSAEAGLGKSRLAQTLGERLGEVPHLRLLYQCSPYHTHSAFYPIMAHLERTVQLEQVASTAAKLDRLETLLAQAGLPVAQVAPLFAALLSIPSDDRYDPLFLSPERQKERTMAAWAELVVGLSQRGPVLAIFEDVHWSDPTTLEALAYVIDRAQDARVLLVLTFRPEFVPPWGHFAHVTTYTLNRLTSRQVVAMVEQIADGKLLPATVLGQIVEKTDGVPLFVEELTRAVLESDMLRDTGSRYEVTQPVEMTSIPITLHDSLMARLDRLSTAKHVAQLGAVIGRQFSYDLVKTLTAYEETQLQYELGQLVEAELVYQRGQFPSTTYMFKHALVQEVAYESLLRRQRQALHGAIAQAIETLEGTQAAEQAAILAYHYIRSSHQDKAVTYSLLAGDQAVRLYAQEEATSYYNQALTTSKQLSKSPETQRFQIDAILKLAAIGASREEMERNQTNLEQAQALTEALADQPRLSQVFYWLGRITYTRGDFSTAISHAEQSLSIADKLSDEALAAPPVNLMGRIYFLLSDYTRSSQLLARSVEQMQALGNLTEAALAAGFASLTFGFLGDFALAHAYADRGVQLAQELQNPFTASAAYGYRAVMHAEHGSWEKVIADCKEGRRIADQIGDLFRVYTIKFIEGRAYIYAGHLAQGRILLEECIALAKQLDTTFCLAWPHTDLATCYLGLGAIDAAITICREALRIAEESSDRYGNARAKRVLAEVLCSQDSLGHMAEAERSVLDAMGIQKELGNSPELARSHVSYARVLQKLNQYDKAQRYFTVAIDMFHEMGMDWDLAQAEQVLRTKRM